MFEPNFSQFAFQPTIRFEGDVSLPKDFYPKEPWIIRVIMRRLQLDMNTFILMVGQPRSGKSYAALSIAKRIMELQGKNFDLDSQLCFDDLKKFLIWSSNSQGSVFILDETGAAMGPDAWFTLESTIMRRFCQTQGFRKNIVIWVLPHSKQVQGAFRVFVNYAINMVRRQTALVYKNKVDPLRDWKKFNYPSYRGALKIGELDSELANKYELIKRSWNNEDLAAEIRKIDEKNLQLAFTPRFNH